MFVNTRSIIILYVIVNVLVNLIQTFSSNSTQGNLVKRFSCVNHNWEDRVECTWDYSVSLDVTNISIQWLLIMSSENNCQTFNQIWNPCPNPSDNMKSCIWYLYDDIDPYKTFQLRITSISLQKSSCYVVTIQDIVKPDRVLYLETTSKNPTSVKLIWQHNLYIYNKTFNLMVSSVRLPKRKIVIDFEYINYENQTCTTKSRYTVVCEGNTVSITVTGLFQFTRYLFSVSSKPVYRGFWSDAVSVLINTSKDVPSASPQLTEGCYSVQSTSTNTSIITVYWGPLPVLLWNDEHISYKVQFTVNGVVIKEHITENFFTSIDNATPGLQIVVLLWAKNTIGFSRHPSIIKVNNIDSHLPDNIIGLIYKRDKMSVYWNFDGVGVGIVKYYQIFWCVRKFSNICKDTPAMMKIGPLLKNGTFPLISNTSSDYLFGVSYTTTDNRSSGFYWSDCIVDFLSQESSENQLQLKVRQENGAVMIKWWLNRCNADIFTFLVDYYIIQMCHGQNCSDYSEHKILATEKGIAFETEKKFYCVRVISIWKIQRELISHIECADIKQSRDTKVPVLLGVGSIVLITAFVGCIGLTRKLSKGVKKVAEPFEIELPFIKQNGT